jgi:hypothetical protein
LTSESIPVKFHFPKVNNLNRWSLLEIWVDDPN